MEEEKQIVENEGGKFSYDVKVPKDRLAVLIGKSGEVKKQVEQETKTRISIDSEEGDVTIVGEDPLGLYSAREIVKAIGRGFNPEFALQLLKPDYNFELFNITDYAGNNKNSLQRLKGRVIGKEGKARMIIEELCEVNICVYGKTVGIIGEIENVSIARRAIESLLTGSPHSNIYKWLEKRRKELRMQKMLEKEI
jgi:ribosomal RNA assembly protein